MQLISMKFKYGVIVLYGFFTGLPNVNFKFIFIKITVPISQWRKFETQDFFLLPSGEISYETKTSSNPKLVPALVWPTVNRRLNNLTRPHIFSLGRCYTFEYFQPTIRTKFYGKGSISYCNLKISEIFLQGM